MAFKMTGSPYPKNLTEAEKHAARKAARVAEGKPVGLGNRVASGLQDFQGSVERVAGKAKTEVKSHKNTDAAKNRQANRAARKAKRLALDAARREKVVNASSSRLAKKRLAKKAASGEKNGGGPPVRTSGPRA